MKDKSKQLFDLLTNISDEANGLPLKERLVLEHAIVTIMNHVFVHYIDKPLE